MTKKMSRTTEAPAAGASAHLQRRRLLQHAAAGGAALAVLGGLGAAGASEKSAALVRPPGFRGEDAFSARCLRCDRCRSACHTGVIGVGGWADGLLVMRTPVMNFHHGYCDFCGKCAEVCPTGALVPFDKETEKIGLARVTEHCVALRTAACTKCYDECPFDAIELDAQNRPIILSDRCNGCGKCEEICPANIFQAYSGGSVRGIAVEPLSKEEEEVAR